MKLLLATRSPHKAAEMRRILAGALAGATATEGAPAGTTATEDALAPVAGKSLDALGLRLLSPEEVGVPESPEEEGLERFDTFEENAAAKAEWFARLSGIPAVADDSGLEVDALGGRPGVRTKRFAPEEAVEACPGLSRDEANNRHLLRLLDGVPRDRRGARYVCVASLALPGAAPVHFRGEAPGLILESPRGAGGFGYDPIVLAPWANRAYAELSPEEKDRRSHRGQAFRALAAHLAQAPHLAQPPHLAKAPQCTKTSLPRAGRIRVATQ